MSYDGETIRRARVLAGLTQAELGEQVGSERSVARWEREGLNDRSHYTKHIERVLNLTDPAVLRAIRDMDTPTDSAPDIQPAPAALGDPRELGDGELLATIDALTAELKRRFWEAKNAPRRRAYGQPGSYRDDLNAHAATDSPTTSHSSEGSSHDRAGSTA